MSRTKGYVFIGACSSNVPDTLSAIGAPECVIDEWMSYCGLIVVAGISGSGTAKMYRPMAIPGALSLTNDLARELEPWVDELLVVNELLIDEVTSFIESGLKKGGE